MHIDEEVLIAMGYRFLQGDKFFIDIQEPQMLLAPLLGGLEAIWIWGTGSTDGILVYMRILSYLILSCTSIFMFVVFKQHCTKLQALAATAVYHFYHFRYVNIMDYTFLYCTAAVLCILFYMNYSAAKYKLLNICFAGISFSTMCLCFPSAILLFPFYMVMYWKKAGKMNAALLLGICLIAAVIESVIIFSDIGFFAVFSAVQQLISSSTYMKNPTPHKSVKFLLLIVSIYICYRHNNNNILLKLSKYVPMGVLQKWCRALSYVLLFYGLLMVARSEFLKLEYFNKSSYLYLLLFVLLRIGVDRVPRWICLLFIWGLACDLTASFMTKYDTAYVYALPAFLAVGVLLAQDVRRIEWPMRLMPASALCLLVCAEIFAEVLMISNNNHSGDTIFNQELIINYNGPAKWAVSRVIDNRKYTEIYNWIKLNISEPIKVCYFGKNVLLYLMSPYINAVVPQLFMDYADDKILGEYYRLYPMKLPDIVILDISPTTKRQITGNEKEIFKDYDIVYQSLNYKILGRQYL